MGDCQQATAHVLLVVWLRNLIGDGRGELKSAPQRQREERGGRQFSVFMNEDIYICMHG